MFLFIKIILYIIILRFLKSGVSQLPLTVRQHVMKLEVDSSRGVHACQPSTWKAKKKRLGSLRHIQEATEKRRGCLDSGLWLLGKISI